MPLAPGTRLGPYEVLSPLGAGGMGEVYRARDARLNRDVAVKTLPSAFANDSGRMARFEREAQVLAALNHPNIAAIYGIEEGALIMELVEGETLAERISHGPIPLDEAIVIARQIADALEAAHEKNIIHRDLKPANVKITPEGKVKVLDFGLAKAFESDAPSGDRTLIYGQRMEATQKIQLWVLPLPQGGVENKPYPFLQSAFNEQAPQLSPDGKWLAYQSDESGSFHVYVRPFPGPGPKTQISTRPGATIPRWSRDGRELFYREGGDQYFVVDIQTAPQFRAGQPQPLFKRDGLGFDVAPDGKRLLIVRLPQTNTAGGAKLEVVTDWFEELRRIK